MNLAGGRYHLSIVDGKSDYVWHELGHKFSRVTKVVTTSEWMVSGKRASCQPKAEKVQME